MCSAADVAAVAVVAAVEAMTKAAVATKWQVFSAHATGPFLKG